VCNFFFEVFTNHNDVVRILITSFNEIWVFGPTRSLNMWSFGSGKKLVWPIAMYFSDLSTPIEFYSSTLFRGF